MHIVYAKRDTLAEGHRGQLECPCGRALCEGEAVLLKDSQVLPQRHLIDRIHCQIDRYKQWLPAYRFQTSPRETELDNWK
jgi:hypothetical protein